jgi:hypothetical protein
MAGLPRTIESKQILQKQRYAVGVAHGNPDLLAVVDSVISGQELSGSIEAIEGSPIERIRRRGVLRIGIRSDQPESVNNDVARKERDIALGVARAILGDKDKIRLERLSVAERVEALSPLSQFLNKLLDSIAVITTALNGNWWHLGMCGRLPEFLCPKNCVGQQDFVGLDYYWGINVLEF